MQLLNRRQTELRLIVLPLAAFCVSDTQGQGDTPVDSPPTELPMGHLILQEKAQEWLNVRTGGDVWPRLTCRNVVCFLHEVGAPQLVQA